MEFALRKAVPSDRAKIEELFIEMLRTIYQKTDVSGYEAGYLDKFFIGAGDWICVAEADGQTIAFLSIEEHHEPSDYIYLDDLSVGGDYRGHGIGTALIETAEQYARDRGMPQIIFHVEKSNTGAYKLYRRLGFADGKDEGTRIRMQKAL